MDDDEEMYFYLQRKENYSEYVRDLVNRDRLDSLDSVYIKKRKEELREEIKKLDGLMKSTKNNSDQVREILESGLKGYNKRNSEVLVGPSQNRLWIRSSVLPHLKKAGSRLSEYEVLKMFESGEINV